MGLWPLKLKTFMAIKMSKMAQNGSKVSHSLGKTFKCT